MDAIPPPSRPPQQRRGSSGGRRATVAAVVVVALAVLVALITIGRAAWREEGVPSLTAPAAATPASASDSPPSTLPPRRRHSGLRLGGVPLRLPSGLRLLVTDIPAPFVMDVGRGTVQPITELPTYRDSGISVLPVGRHALVLSTRFCDRCRGSSAYLVRRGEAAATRLGTALGVAPARDGQGVWMLRSQGAGRCTIREIELDGRPRQADRRVSCRTGLVAELPEGLLVSSTGPLGSDAHNALLKPNRVVRLPYEHAQPLVDNLVLRGADRRMPIVLEDVRSGASHRLRWPSRPGYSLGDVTGDPNGRFAVVEFAKYSPEHRLDMWLLDLTSRRWQHVPDMPARISPKGTDVEWTSDGRVVVLSGNALGVWRPGAPRLAVHRVKPPRQPGSEFVVW